jgi:hypothetical protein
VDHDARPSIPMQLRLPELAAQQQDDQGKQAEAAANPDQPVPLSMPPGSLNGTAG